MCLHTAPGPAESGCTDPLASSMHRIITGKWVFQQAERNHWPQRMSLKDPLSPTCTFVHRGSKKLLLCLQCSPRSLSSPHPPSTWHSSSAIPLAADAQFPERAQLP